VAGSVSKIHQALLERPIASPNWLTEQTELSAATVNACLKHLEKINVVEELTGQKRNRLYSYSQYIEVMNQGTELPA
jgi:cell filamentation protein, protein adenylyltransferase